MSTARWCRTFDIPERTWRGWQAKARLGKAVKGPWPQPAREAAAELIDKHAPAHPVWGHPKVWAMVRHDGHVVSKATVLRRLRDQGLILPEQYQRERRKLESEGGSVRHRAERPEPGLAAGLLRVRDHHRRDLATGGGRDYWSKHEHRFHVSPTANQHDAIDAVELALADHEAMFGHPMVEDCNVHAETGEILPVVTIVTDNGGPFRSFRFEAFIAANDELHHVRTRVRTPGQNGSRERGSGTLEHERLFIDEIDDAVMLAKHAEEYRIENNQIRPHEDIAWNRPQEVHLGLADPTIPTFQSTEILRTP